MRVDSTGLPAVAPDRNLVERIAAGDESALLALYRLYANPAYSLIYRIVRDETVAEEVLQDTFFRLWCLPHSYDPDKGALLSWLFTVARNLALDRRRKESRRPLAFVSEFRDARNDDFAGPDAALEKRYTVIEALRQLPKEQRIALELAYFEGLTHTELADRLREPVGTVKTRIRLGMRKLKALLKDCRLVIL